MPKKDETILIRLDSETKDKFRELCESKNSNMSTILLDKIKDMILNFELSNESSNITELMSERNFYKKELDNYKQTYFEMNKMLSALNKKNIINESDLYCDLILNNFEKIKQFKGYEIIKDHKSQTQPDFIALNKSLNRKLLIETKIGSIDSIFMGTRRDNYKRLFDKYYDTEDIELVLIFLNPINDERIDQRLNSLSKRIGHKISVYAIEDILDFYFNSSL